MKTEMNTPKIPYKIENLLNEAGALYDFFNKLTTNKEENANDLSKRLIQNYQLEGEHYKRFEKISQRAERAQGIIKYLENKFEIDEKGYFINKEMFYWDVFDKDIPKNTKLKSYNIAIANIQDIWKYKKRMGFANGFTPFENSLSGNQQLEELFDNEDIHISQLFFNIPSFETFIKILDPEEKDKKALLVNVKKDSEKGLIQQIFYFPKYESKYKKNINHELRHIFDNIIYTGIINEEEDILSYFTETQAYMYDETNVLHSLDLDLKKGTYFLKKQIKKRKERLERLTQIKAPEAILKNEKNILEESAKKLSGIKTNIKSVGESLNEKFHASDKEVKSLSYFFSILPEEEVPYYIKKAREFYNEREISNEIKEEFNNLSDKI